MCHFPRKSSLNSCLLNRFTKLIINGIHAFYIFKKPLDLVILIGSLIRDGFGSGYLTEILHFIIKN
ncbi:IspD protein [Listeria monocytogenes]|nr:IspD protein [Listeria monocytogenes]